MAVQLTMEKFVFQSRRRKAARADLNADKSSQRIPAICKRNWGLQHRHNSGIKREYSQTASDP